MTDGTEKLGGMLIFCVTLLVVFVGLFALMPSELLVTAESRSYTQKSSPLNWEGLDMMAYVYTANGTLDSNYIDWAWLHLDLKDSEGHVKDSVIAAWTSSGHKLWLDHYFSTWWGLWWDQHGIACEVPPGYSSYPLHYAELNVTWHADGNYSYLRGKCDHGLVFNFYFTYNMTKYSSLQAAWDAYELNIFVGQGYDDTFAKMDAWSLIGLLLSFQAPEVFGATGSYALTLNLFIAIPIWTCIAYIFYRLVLMAIPFVGG